MLNILEFNQSLYSALTKQKRDRDLIQNYSREIRHADGGFESECRNKLIEWGKIQPEGRDGLIAMLAEVNKYLRKANKNNIDKDVIKQILGFRNELSAKVEGKADKELSHGGKWKDHDYLYIDTNGNYVYAKDLAKKKGASKTSNAANTTSTTQNDAEKKYSDAVKNLNSKYGVNSSSEQKFDDKATQYEYDKMLRKIQSENRDHLANLAKNTTPGTAEELGKAKYEHDVAEAKKAETIRKNREAAEALAKMRQDNSTIAKEKKAKTVAKNAEAAQHEGDRYSKEVIDKQKAVDTQRANEYKEAKAKEAKDKERQDLANANASSKEAAIKKASDNAKAEKISQEMTAIRNKAANAAVNMKSENKEEPSTVKTFLDAVGNVAGALLDYKLHKSKYKNSIGHSDEDAGYKGMSEEEFRKYARR